METDIHLPPSFQPLFPADWWTPHLVSFQNLALVVVQNQLCWIFLGSNLTVLEGTQMAGKALFLDMSVRMFWEETGS